MIAELLNKKRTDLGAQPKNKDEVLHQAAKLLASDQGAVGISEEDIYKLLLERENLGSTGIGGGFAIPHATLPGASEITIALITVPEGVDFDSLDGKPARAIFAMTAPADQRSAHVRNLAELSRFAKDPKFLDRLVSSEDFKHAHALFDGENEGKAGKVKTQAKTLLMAIIQKSEYLEPLLEVLAGITDSESVVLDGHGAGRYLQALPLFSMFWTEENRRTEAQVVMAIIDRHAGNETLRRITASVADPAREEGLLVALQDLSLVSGSLEL